VQVRKDAARAFGAAAFVIAGACASPSERPPGGTLGHSAGRAGSAGSASSAGGTGGRAAYGLAERPENPGCRAPSRPAGQASDPFPLTLSATGCTDPAEPLRPSSGLIEYDVNAPLYSDGASKRRWLALPDGARIGLDTTGDFDLPVGSVLMKLFTLGETPVETRLLVRHADGEWAGYSYAWREDGSDADLLETTVVRSWENQEWIYPSRENCLECHTAAAGRSLGLELGQLNRDIDYPNGRFNQLATFQHIGLFSAELPSDPLPLYPPPTGKLGSAAERARAYLHANCANCHRPGGASEVTLDLRYTTPLEEMRVCDVEPSKGNFGLLGAKLLKPKDAALSLLSFRMHTSISSVRMPPIGRTLSDMDGIAVVDAWIDELDACP
jgi:uncharacterized repeat protein (TIGR03806 family)